MRSVCCYNRAMLDMMIRINKENRVSDYPPLQQIAGNVGRDPEVRNTGKGDVVKFSVAVSRGYGDDAPTEWYDAAVFNDQLRPVVLREIHKGTRVVLEGTVKERQVDGKTYRDFVANRVGVVEWLRRDQAPAADGLDSI